MADCIIYDTGLWVRHHTDVLLRTPQGLSYRKATPAVVDVVLDELDDFTDQAEEAIESGPESAEKTRLMRELQRWQNQLLRMHEHVDQAIAKGDNDPASIYHCVTAPLTLGWMPNVDCTGPDPAQKRQQVALVAAPLSLLNQANCLRWSLTDFDVSIRGYWEHMQEGFEAIAEGALEVERYVEKTIARGIKPLTQNPFPTALVVVGALAVGLYIITR